MDDVPQIDPKELEELMSKSDDELLKMFGDYLRQQVIACFNEALTAAGGRELIKDGVTRPMSEYIDIEKLPTVLQEARYLAEERNLTVGEAGDPSAVVTDDDALAFIHGK